MNSPATGVLVIGAGLAGSSAAITLARAGREVTLLEKELEPHHKVCGEFLSHEALSSLHALGIDAAAIGAVPIHSVRLAGRLGVSEVALPFAAMSLTRRKLDEELLCLAANVGSKILRGHRVQKLERNAKDWQITLDNAQTIYAPTVFHATGKHDLHSHARPNGTQNDLIAFKMYWRLAPQQSAQLEGHVELCLYRGGYCGLQPVEGGIANLCCLIRRSVFQQIGGKWEALLQSISSACPHLHQRLEGAIPMLSRPLAISAIPYGFIRQTTEDLWHLGDQAAVIPSFTGDGMSIALHSGRLAAEMFLDGASPRSFQQRLHDQLAQQVPFATFLSKCLVTEPQRTVMEAIARLWPGVLGLIAKRTRLREATASPNPVAISRQTMGTY
jgi:menaquinone-9 beta-reductase